MQFPVGGSSSETGQMPMLLKAFKQAIRDDRIEMIVFRIDSSGGMHVIRVGEMNMGNP